MRGVNVFVWKGGKVVVPIIRLDEVYQATTWIMWVGRLQSKSTLKFEVFL